MLPKCVVPWAYKHKSSTIKNYPKDKTTDVDYTFNSLGYRSSVEFDAPNPIVVLGNTMSFGLGLPYEQTYASIVEQQTKTPVYNLSWGCYAHTINDQLEFLQDIYNCIEPKLVIFQINNLNRYRLNKTEVSFDNSKDIIESEYNRFHCNLHKTIANKNIILMHWDGEQHDVELPPLLIYNKYIIDQVPGVRGNPPGMKSHKLIAFKILQEIG
jgi:hypothetical protein